MKIVILSTFPAGKQLLKIPIFKKKDFSWINKYGWNSRFSKKLKEYYGNLDIECWSLYESETFGDSGIQILKSEGVTFKAFPCKKIFGLVFSYEIIKEIFQRTRSKEKILLHVQTFHDIKSLFLSFFCKDIPLIAQHRGGIPYSLKFKSHPKPEKRGNYLHLLGAFFEKIALKNFDFVIACGISEYTFLSSRLGKDKVRHLHGTGLDFDLDDHFLDSIDREKIKKELGLDPSKKHLLHIVSGFNKRKGTLHIAKAYNILKKEMDLELVVIGGYPDDSNKLYRYLKLSGVHMTFRISNKEVNNYLSCSDALICVMVSGGDKYFSGFPTAAIEALKFGLPQVNTQFVNFPSDEWKSFGRVPISFDDIIDQVREILKLDRFKPSEISKIGRKYYDWNYILKLNLDVYQDQFRNYYGVEIEV